MRAECTFCMCGGGGWGQGEAMRRGDRKRYCPSERHGMLVRVCERGAAARHARGQTSGQWETYGPRPVLTSRLGGSP
eukprot:scaffold1547_cov151-Isochrysis_galbana.AAC.2